MTDPNRVVTVDAPVATEPPGPLGPPLLRVPAALAGVPILVVGGLASLGGVVVGASASDA
jgi:hypothetical protein